MRILVLWCAIVALSWAVSGCTGFIALGPERWRIIEIEGEGFETFCWDGVEALGVDVGAIGWGEHSCEDIAPEVD